MLSTRGLFVLCVNALLLLSGAHGSDILSDLTSSSLDENRALEIKAGAFWTGVLEVADTMKMQEHLTLYDDAAAMLAALPSENTYVREALGEALARLRAADAAVLEQGVSAADLARLRLGAPAGAAEGDSFFSGTNLFAQAVRRFVGEGDYSERLLRHVAARQADLLPRLRSTARAARGVLADCHAASERSFDALKYDLYHTGVPKTPEAAKSIANRIVDAAAQTRGRFTRYVAASATSIAQDVQSREEPAAATVTRDAVARSAADARSLVRGEISIETGSVRAGVSVEQLMYM